MNWCKFHSVLLIFISFLCFCFDLRGATGKIIPEHPICGFHSLLLVTMATDPGLYHVIHVPGRARLVKGIPIILLADQAGQVHGYLLKARSVNDEKMAHPWTVFFSKTFWGPITHQHKIDRKEACMLVDCPTLSNHLVVGTGSHIIVSWTLTQAGDNLVCEVTHRLLGDEGWNWE